MDADGPWEYSDTDPLSLEESLTITIFLIDPYGTGDKLLDKLSLYFTQLKQTIIQPFQDNYPFYLPHAGLKLDLELFPSAHAANRSDYPFIMCQLPTSSNDINDMYMITSLLFEFLNRDPDLYMHCYDGDGEFLVADGADYSPDWLTPEMAANRLWMNNGQLKFIPNDYYKDKPLSLLQAIKFLEKANYNCLIFEEFNRVMIDKLNKSVRQCLSTIVVEEILVDKSTANKIISLDQISECSTIIADCITSHIMSPFLFNNYKSEQMRINKIENPSSKVKLNVRLSAYDHAQFVTYITKDSQDPIVEMGQFVDFAFKDIDLSNDGADKYDAWDKYNSDIKADLLQSTLVKHGIISEIYEMDENYFQDLIKDSQKPETNDTVNQEEEYERLIKKMQSFFSKESDFDGVDSKRKPTGKSINEKKKGNDQDNFNAEKFEYDSDNYNDDSDYSSDEENVKFRQFFKDEKVDVDEDDFFEYFCKEALKMKDEDMEQFRAKINDKTQNENVEDEDDVADEDSQDRLEFGDFSRPEDLAEAREAMMNAIKSMGGQGPAAAFLNSLGLEDD